jgi:hypothetical protein
MMHQLQPRSVVSLGVAFVLALALGMGGSAVTDRDASASLSEKTVSPGQDGVLTQSMDEVIIQIERRQRSLCYDCAARQEAEARARAAAAQRAAELEEQRARAAAQMAAQRINQCVNTKTAAIATCHRMGQGLAQQTGQSSAQCSAAARQRCNAGTRLDQRAACQAHGQALATDALNSCVDRVLRQPGVPGQVRAQAIGSCHAQHAGFVASLGSSCGGTASAGVSEAEACFGFADSNCQTVAQQNMSLNAQSVANCIEDADANLAACVGNPRPGSS